MIHVEFIYVMTSLAVILGFWVAPSWLTARLAERKGRSFTGWLLAALFLCWPLVLLLALIVPNRRPA